jgi:hypothetical protein
MPSPLGLPPRTCASSSSDWTSRADSSLGPLLVAPPAAMRLERTSERYLTQSPAGPLASLVALSCQMTRHRSFQ